MTAAGPPGLAPPWPMVGRDALIAEIVAVVSAPPEAPGATGVIVVGAEGSGKTAVARAVSRLRVAAGSTCVWVSGGPHTRDVAWGAVRHLLPGGPPTAASDPTEAVTRLLAAGGPNGLLVVDDLHLVDRATVGVLARLVARRAVRLVATWPQGAGPRDRLSTAVGTGMLDVRELSPLDTATVEAVLRRSFSGDLADGTAAHLTHASGGNPRRLMELVTQGMAQGTLQPVDGRWQWVEATATGPGLGDQLDAVSPLVSRVLDVVAMADGAAGPDIVVATVERLNRTDGAFATPDRPGDGTRTAADVQLALAEAEALGLVRVVSSGLRQGVVLVHREAAAHVRARMGDMRARRTVLALADEIDRFGGRRAVDVLRTARWRVDATGTAPRAQLLSACHIAARSGDVDSLERLAWAVLREAPDPAAATLLADALIDHGRFAEAAGLLDNAESLAGDDEATVVRVALARATLAGTARSRHDEAVEHLEEVQARVTDPQLSASLRAARLVHELWRSGPTAALAGDRIPQPRSPDSAGSDPGARALALALAGDTREALAVTSGWEPRSTLAALAAALAAADDGQLDRAMTTADDGHSEAAWAGLGASRMWFTIVCGRIALRQGSWDAAGRWFADAASLAEECGLPGGARLAAAGSALAAAWRGDTELPPLPIDIDAQTPLLLVAEPVLARAWGLAGRGDVPGAGATLAAGYLRAVSRGALPDAAWIAHSYVRLGEPDRAAAAIEPLRSRLGGALVLAWADHARAATDRDHEALAAVAQRFTAAGAYPDAAAAVSATTDPAATLAVASH